MERRLAIAVVIAILVAGAPCVAAVAAGAEAHATSGQRDAEVAPECVTCCAAEAAESVAAASVHSPTTALLRVGLAAQPPLRTAARDILHVPKPHRS